MYDLRVHGLRDLGRRTLFQTRKINRDALSGVLDGTNTVFRSTFYPMASSGSIYLYDSSGSTITQSKTVDYDTGTVVFTAAPTVQRLASYTYRSMTDDELVDVLMQGFDEMQTRWNRPLYLSSTTPAYAAAVGTESHIYVVTKVANVVSDPVCGSSTFSAQRVQVGFYILCCEYVALQNKANSLVQTAFRFREALGPSVDQSMMPRNLEGALERLNDRLDMAREIAWAQYYREGEPWGGYTAPVITQVYDSTYLWQDEARDQDRTSS